MGPDREPDSLTLAEVRAAAARIDGRVLRTPLLHRAVGGVELLCKAESLQPTGAFKLRGAFSLMSALPRGTRGVVTHSSGNHAQAVAWAARALGLSAVIVMPDDAPEVKRARTEALGAEIVRVGSDSDERVRRADELAQARDMVLVPPYDDLRVAAGQGTAALEMLEEIGSLQRFYAPVGGGGLMAGRMVRLTPKGLSVISRQREISLRRSSGVGWVSAVRMPRPPAFDTAEASSA